MSDAAITGLSLVVVNLLVLLGVLAGVRQSRKAGAESTELGRETLEVQKREKLVEDLSDQLDRLWPRLEKMDEREEQQRQRIDHLEHENADLRHHTVTCARDVDDLSQRIDDYARRYGVAVRYVKRLHDWMAQHLPGDLKPPAPPEGLAFDLEDPMHADEHPPPPSWPPRGPGPGRTV